MKLLMALDGSTGSDAVLREVAARPWPAGSECCVLTAIDPFFFTKAPLVLAEAKKDAQTALDGTVEVLKKTGLQLRTEIVMENPRHGIPRAAKEWNADLIVMGSHGRGAFRAAVGGEHGAGGFAARAMFGRDCARRPAEGRKGGRRNARASGN